MTIEQELEHARQAELGERKVIAYLIAEMAAGRYPVVDPAKTCCTRAERRPHSFTQPACPVHEMLLGWPLTLLSLAMFRFRPPADKVLA